MSEQPTNPTKKLRGDLNFRGKTLAWVVMFLFFLVALRGTYLSTFSTASELLNKIAARQYKTQVGMAPNRGSIYDRNGDALAVSIDVPSIAVNPRVFKPTPRQARAIAKHLGITKVR